MLFFVSHVVASKFLIVWQLSALPISDLSRKVDIVGRTGGILFIYYVDLPAML
jgi:hypothetical protein